MKAFDSLILSVSPRMQPCQNTCTMCYGVGVNGRLGRILGKYCPLALHHQWVSSDPHQLCNKSKETKGACQEALERTASWANCLHWRIPHPASETALSLPQSITPCPIPPTLLELPSVELPLTTMLGILFRICSGDLGAHGYVRFGTSICNAIKCGLLEQHLFQQGNCFMLTPGMGNTVDRHESLLCSLHCEILIGIPEIQYFRIQWHIHTGEGGEQKGVSLATTAMKQPANAESPTLYLDKHLQQCFQNCGSQPTSRLRCLTRRP